MSPDTLLDVFSPPEGLVGHSAALVAMTGTEDFLEDAMQRFTGLRPRQRAELGVVLAYLMLDAHASPSRAEVLPPGRVPGLHELQPRAVQPGSLLHAKLALLAFAPTRFGAPAHLRLAVLTANFTYSSARQQLELVWLVDVPLDGSSRPEDRADVKAAAAFLEDLIARRFHRDERSLPVRERSLTKRLDVLLEEAGRLRTSRAPRFVHSLDRPLYEQITERFRKAIDKPRNFLLCGSGFYEAPARRAGKPLIFRMLEEIDVFTPSAYRVALVEPDDAGAVAGWGRDGETEGWSLVRPFDPSGHDRRLHAKFVYAGYLRDGYASRGWLYLGSGNLSRRGLLSHGGMSEGNVESGVVFEVPERLSPAELERRLFWSEHGAGTIDEDEWAVGAPGDAPDAPAILQVPPILSAIVRTSPGRHLRMLWREDATNERPSVSWTGRDWCEVVPAQDLTLQDGEHPTALHVRLNGERTWTVPVVDEEGRVGWQPPRFASFGDAMAALLDFPIRSDEAIDDDEGDAIEGGHGPACHFGGSTDHERDYALHSAARMIEGVAALQSALPESMIDDWIDHVDRMLRASFPEHLIMTWRSHRLDVFAHLRQPELRPPGMTDRQRIRYLDVLEGAAHAWGLR